MTPIKSFLAVTLLKFLSFLPLSVSRYGGRFLGRVLWWSNSQSRQIIEENLQICFPDMPIADKEQLTRQRLQHLCMMALEVAGAWRWPVEKVMSSIDDVAGREVVDAAAAEGKGVLILIPHLGNWEVLGIYLATHFTTTSLYQPPKLKALDTLIREGRSRNGSTLVPTNASGVRALLKALKRGEMVCILPDQEPELSGGDFAPFFNEPALTTSLSSNLAQRTGARVVAAFAQRLEDGGGFRVEFRAVEDGIYSGDIHQSLVSLNNSVEDCVMCCPEQYQWEYKRFKTTPNGKRKYLQAR